MEKGMARAPGRNMSRYLKTFEICFCWTCVGVCLSVFPPSGDCDHYDRVLPVAS